MRQKKTTRCILLYGKARLRWSGSTTGPWSGCSKFPFKLPQLCSLLSFVAICNLHCWQYNPRATVPVPPVLESSQKRTAECFMEPGVVHAACNTKCRTRAWCSNPSLRTWVAFLLSCPRVSCVIKDMDRLEKQSLVMFFVYKALAVTCYTDKKWESLIS